MQKKLMYGMVILAGMGFGKSIQADEKHKATGLGYDDILFVNMTDAMLLSAQGKEAQTRVEAEEKKYAELAQKEQQRMMQLKNDLDTKVKASMLTVEAHRKMERELNDMQRDFQNNMQTWREDLQFVMQKETEIMIKDIEQSAKLLAQQSNKAAVIDAQTGRILYLREDKNSTSALVALMDTQYTVRLAQSEKPAQGAVLASKDAPKKNATA